MRNMVALIRERLSDDVYSRLCEVGRTAVARNERAFIVGGFVRDLILKRHNLDVDVMVEGDGISIARILASKWHVEITVHQQFLTATLAFLDGSHMDIATARRERYPKPATLPIVEPATATEDLWRRDFSINAIAVSIMPHTFGEILDPCGGIADIERGIVRVLHSRSFIDDPTRMFRAVRFEQRFGFVIEPATLELLHQARDAGYIELLTADRIKHEWIRLIDEPEPPRYIYRLVELDLLRRIHPALQLRSAFAKNVLNALLQIERRAQELAPDMSYKRWLLYTMPLLHGAPCEAIESLCERYSIGEKGIRAFMQIQSAYDALYKLHHDTPPSTIKEVWDAFAPEAMLYAWACATVEASYNPAVSFKVEQMEAYIHHYRHVKPDITGDDIIATGIPPGWWIGEGLKAALKIKLDENADRDAQLSVALQATQVARASIDE